MTSDAPPGDAESPAGTWTIDPRESNARFVLTYLVVARLKGRFGWIEGTVTIDETDTTRSSVAASIDVSTIDTGIAIRDAHLRSGTFFSAARFPRMTFRSTRVDRSGDAKWRVAGELTIRDVTKEVVLDTRYNGQKAEPQGSRRAAFVANASLSRRAFGLGRGGLIGPGGAIVSDEVRVSLQISAISG